MKVRARLSVPALVWASVPAVLLTCLCHPASATENPGRAQPAVFLKAVPESIRDLKEIQAHVQSVIKRVMPATVNLRIGNAQGSGVIINAEGHVLTAGHVSGKPGIPVQITLPDGRKLRGITLGANTGIDSGLVQITEKATFPYVEMAESAELEKGQWCLALGHPGGYQPGRAPVVRVGRILDVTSRLIRTDCALVGGDSGGPLFDMNGRVIGIHSRIGGSMTYNIHVPVDTYRDTWERLVASETWADGQTEWLTLGRRQGSDAYLGIRTDASDTGCRIASVNRDSPAARAGLQADDLLLAIGGEDVRTLEDLAESLAERRPGQRIVILVERAGEQLAVTVILGKRPS